MSLHQMPGFRPGICCLDSIYQPIDVLTPNAWLQARNLLLRLYIPAHWCPYTKCLASGQESAAHIPVHRCPYTKCLASGKESAAQTLNTSPLMSLYLFSTGRSSLVGCASTWYADGCGFDPHVRHHLFVKIWPWHHFHWHSPPLPLIQVGQLSVTGERMCTKYRLTALEACPGIVWLD